MSLRESAWGGVYLSPLFVYALLALAATAALRVLIQKNAVASLVWHEALFDCALFILMLSGITWAATT
ncbi:DUF1656 domain-containing protein [Pseudomonas aeruginosa]|nr:DUF1656 domain-containing protein [Pseudomonas aeruginosa]